MISRCEKSGRKPLVFIAHPIRGRISVNLINASKWLRWAASLETVVPIAPYIGTCMALDDRDPTERLAGMAISSRVLKLCDEMWLCGLSITEGMENEIQAAVRHDIPVVDLTGHTLPSGMIGGSAW